MLTPSIFGESLFDELFGGFAGFPAFDDAAVRKAQKQLYGHRAPEMMKTDVRDHNDHYELDIDLPGFSKDELSLELKDGYLLISAAKSLNRDEQDTASGRLVRQERYMGSMSRAFYVGESIKQEDIRARYESGVLRLFVPKESPQPALEEKKYIAIEG